MSGWQPDNRPRHVAGQRPAVPQAQRMPAVRRRPPYPWHQVRFPWKALPGSRRRRGPSLGRMFYLGRHPIALLIQACILMIAFEVIAAWVALVAMFWAAQVTFVTIAWLLACWQARTRA